MIVGVVRHVTIEEARARMAKHAEHVDAFEWRLDTFAGLTPDDAERALGDLAAAPRPVIATCRPTWEGGEFTGSEDERERVLIAAAQQGAAYLDVEARADIAPARHGVRVIRSRHWSDDEPRPTADDIAAVAADADGDVFKFAFPADDIDAALTVMDANAAIAGESVGVALGEFGELSRIAYRRLGSAMTYGALPGEAPISQGQTDVRILRDRYHAHARTAATNLYGLCGDPVAHSRGVRLHNAAFRALGIDAMYLPLRTRDVEALWRVVRALPLSGFSITAPHKVAIRAGFITQDADVTKTGSANTAMLTDNGWHALNTDVFALSTAVRYELPPSPGSRFLVLGAGGAARAAVVAFKTFDSPSVVVSSRTNARAEALAAELGAQWTPWPPADATGGQFNVVINATPAGMAPDIDGLPVDPNTLPTTESTRFVDLVYEPAPTRFLREAEALGFITIDGRAIFESQADLQFRYWTGEAHPRDLDPREEI